MEPSAFDSLSPQQLACLRLVAQQRQTKEIAVALGIRPETVESHIKAARAKLGGLSRFAAARALATHEKPPQCLGTPPLGMAIQVVVGDTQLTDEPETDTGLGHLVREERSPFEHFPLTYRNQVTGGKGGRNDLTTLQRTTLAAGLVLLLALIIIATPPMADSFQRLANLVEKPDPR